MPAAIAALSQLEHLYTSNDETQSYLSGTFPPEIGAMRTRNPPFSDVCPEPGLVEQTGRPFLNV